MSAKNNLMKYCLLYKGEEYIQDNPIDKDKDEFKWQMWRTEFVIVNIVPTIKKVNYEDENVAEEIFKSEILNAINTFCDSWAGGDPEPFIEKYFSY